MSGIFVVPVNDLNKTLAEMDRITQEWTLRAARGECSWICSDCCVVFPDGMPNECVHGQQGCTNIIIRDKKEANAIT